jgi:hypothetical protein
MKANPTKFQGIVFGNKVPDATFKIKDVTIKCEQNVKLLGVHIDTNLKFNKHINSICAKASGQINAIMRLSRILPADTKMAMYRAFVLSNFSYCPVVWMHCGAGNVKKMERLQCRALRFVLNDFTSTYEQLLVMSDETNLTICRMRTLALEVYKCVNKLSPSYLNELFNKHDIHYNMRDSNKLIQRKVNTKCYGLKTFSYAGAKLWNNLPSNIKDSITLDDFKHRIKSWEPCSCDEWL